MVNGFDSVRFTGTCSNDDEWNCHVCGYSFTSTTPHFAIIGLVPAREQDTEMIAAIPLGGVRRSNPTAKAGG